MPCDSCEQRSRDAQNYLRIRYERINKQTEAQADEHPAAWLVYTLMFGYPLPTLQSPQFSNETSCLIYLGTLDQQVVEAFQLVCSRDHA